MEKVAENKGVITPIKRKKIVARDRITPRGLTGLYKGQIFYDKKSDIFNLEL